MTKYIKKPHIQVPSSKVSIVFLSLFLVLLCMVLCFGNPMKIGKTSFMSECISYITNHIFCDNSSTMEYCKQTTYSSFHKGSTSLVWQSPIYTYLQYHSGNKHNESDNYNAVAKVDGASQMSTDSDNTDSSTPTTLDPKDTNVELSSGQDISNGQDPYDDLFFEDLEDEDDHAVFAEANLTANAKQALTYNRKIISTLTSTFDLDYMLKKLYHVNPETGIDKTVFNVKKLLSTDVTLKKNSKEPQILIFHTHAHEWFADSKKGDKSDTIVGVGEELTRILQEDYGYNVIHFHRQYNAKYAYNEALPDIKDLLKRYPSIKVILDVHRDGVSETTKTHTTVNINGETMAKLMFFNGVCQNTKGPIIGYQNPNLQMNLAFSLQMRLFAMENFPQLTKYNFLKSWRYNMHLMERYSLVEVGDNNNTVAEAKAAMKPLAAIIDHVLTTKNSYTQ